MASTTSTRSSEAPSGPPRPRPPGSRAATGLLRAGGARRWRTCAGRGPASRSWPWPGPRRATPSSASTGVRCWIEREPRCELAEEIGRGVGYARTRLASVLVAAGEPRVGRALRRGGGAGRHRGRRGPASVDAHQPGPRALDQRTDGGGGGGRPFGDGGELGSADADVTSLTMACLRRACWGCSAGRDRRELVSEMGSDPRPRAAVPVAALHGGGRGPGPRRRRSTMVPPPSGSRGAVERAGFEPQWRAVALWGTAEVAWLAGRDEEALARRAGHARPWGWVTTRPR